MSILHHVTMFFSGEISVTEMTQEEIHEALPLARKQLQDLISADETPPREVQIAPECRTVQ